MKYCFFATYLLIAFNFLEASECQLIHRISCGAEIYGVSRTKNGGTKQTGVLGGARLTYDRLKRYGWYLGADLLYATGNLRGNSGLEEKLCSVLTDASVEGRFGYTFQRKSGCFFSLTPFFGVGIFRETNDFYHPSPIPVHFRNTFSYVPLGFLSSFYLNDQWSTGIKFTGRFLFKHQNKVTNDSKHHDMTLQYKEAFQYRVEIPITYDCHFCSRLWQVSLTPFYEYRHYGYMANFPFDFLDTKFRFYGANLRIVFLL
jgi:hypothetical protein